MKAVYGSCSSSSSSSSDGEVENNNGNIKNDANSLIMGDKVICIVKRINVDNIRVDILGRVNETKFRYNQRPEAILDIINVRNFEKSKIALSKCFSQGDIIQATIKGADYGSGKKMHMIDTTHINDGVI